MDFIKRMEEEYSELSSRILTLEKTLKEGQEEFTYSTWKLLEAQFTAMLMYQSTLLQRLTNLTTNKE